MSQRIKEQSRKREDYDYYKNKRTDRSINNKLAGRVGNKKVLTEEQIAVVRDYYRALDANPRIKSKETIKNYLEAITDFAIFLKKPFNRATKEITMDYYRYKRQETSDTTSNSSMCYVKAFYKWLYGTDDYPECVKWFKYKQPKREVEFDQLVTWEDVEYVTKFCLNFRDVTIIYVLRDCGGRVEESILRPKIKDLHPDKYGFKLRVDGKTGKRYIRLLNSVPIVKQWLNQHAMKDDPEAPLFYLIGNNCKEKGAPMRHYTVEHMLASVRERSNFKKPLNPHHFRHSSATERAMEGFQEKELRIIYGWSKNSHMPDLYCNFGEKQVDEKLLRQAGKVIDADEKDPNDFKLKKCTACGEDNRPSLIYCSFCGAPLNADEIKNKLATQTDERIKLLYEIAQNPQLMEKFEQFKKSLN